MAKPKKFNLQARIINNLRQLSLQWPAKKEAREKAKAQVHIGYYKNGKPKMKSMYRCQSCNEYFEKKDTQMDHNKPVVPITGFVDWNTHIERLFVSSDKYSCLCKPCHKKKSEDENKKRRAYRKKKS